MSANLSDAIQEKIENLDKALQEVSECQAIPFEVENFEREINVRPIILEAAKRSHNKEKAMQREQMKQMQRYQNRHWKK